MARTFAAAVTPLLPPSPTAHYFLCSERGVAVFHDPGPHPGQAPALRLPTAADVAALSLDPASAHYLGRLDEIDCFALPLPPELPLSLGLSVRNLRKLFGSLDETLFWVAGRAWQIAHWDDTHRFCGRCGGKVERKPSERAKYCAACNLSTFPRVSPAVIVLVRRGRQALLARSARATQAGVPFYSTLAGFVESGESLEETVLREIREEVGITVKNLRYFGSQPWPFPHSLMIGFTAEYDSGELQVDGQEILDARFFDAGELPMIPPPLSIARQLIDAWLADCAQKES
jgi:NAD+ diphosphatase